MGRYSTFRCLGGKCVRKPGNARVRKPQKNFGRLKAGDRNAPAEAGASTKAEGSYSFRPVSFITSVIVCSSSSILSITSLSDSTSSGQISFGIRLINADANDG